ncbi:MAG: GNAT family N-acetyltransferase [Actinobacteria bacterium]|nr:GNAT family N-acetyltransferase [Actinomycetota bacterium]
MTDRARLLDELAANATPAPLTRLVDGWLAKASTVLPFRRAGAVLPASGAGLDHRAASVTLDALEAWYRSLGLRLLVQVSSADPSAAELDALLAARGAEVEAPVDVLVADARHVLDAAAHADDRLRVAVEERTPAGHRRTLGIDVVAGVDEASTLALADRLDDPTAHARTAAYGTMLAPLGGSALVGHVAVDDAVVGVGFAVLERGWAGLFGMATVAAWRRTGVAGTIVGALAEAAADRHGTHLYLQVEEGNEAARQLYEGLGFTRDHGYHYRAITPVRA